MFLIFVIRKGYNKNEKATYQHKCWKCYFLWLRKPYIETKGVNRGAEVHFILRYFVLVRHHTCDIIAEWHLRKEKDGNLLFTPLGYIIRRKAPISLLIKSIKLTSKFMWIFCKMWKSEFYVSILSLWSWAEPTINLNTVLCVFSDSKWISYSDVNE